MIYKVLTLNFTQSLPSEFNSNLYVIHSSKIRTHF